MEACVLYWLTLPLCVPVSQQGEYLYLGKRVPLTSPLMMVILGSITLVSGRMNTKSGSRMATTELGAGALGLVILPRHKHDHRELPCQCMQASLLGTLLWSVGFVRNQTVARGFVFAVMYSGRRA